MNKKISPKLIKIIFLLILGGSFLIFDPKTIILSIIAIITVASMIASIIFLLKRFKRPWLGLGLTFVVFWTVIIGALFILAIFGGGGNDGMEFWIINFIATFPFSLINDDLTMLITPLIWFAEGALIGWLYQLIKNKLNKPKQNSNPN